MVFNETEIESGVKVIKDKLFRYRLIFPIKKEDGKVNWFNLLTGGSWGNLIVVILIVMLCVSLVLAYRHDVATLTECCNTACKNLISGIPQAMPNTQINFGIKP